MRWRATAGSGAWEVEVPGWEAFRLTGVARVVDGEPRVVALHIDPRGDVEDGDLEGLTASRLRGLPLGEIATIAVRGTTFDLDLETGAVEHTAEVEAAIRRVTEREVARHDSRAVTSVEQVAEVWKRAYAAGIAPRGTVCSVLGIEPRTADRYIRRAREMGLIPPSRRHRRDQQDHEERNDR